MIENQSTIPNITFRNNKTYPKTQTVMASPQKLIYCLGHMLTRLIQEAPPPTNKQSKFYCKTKPAISVCDYLKRIYRFAGCSQYIFLKALIYMDRFQNMKQGFSLNQFSVHRQLMCSVMIAAKYSEDFYYTNKHYSKVGGFSEDDINKLQREFLDTVDFNLYVDRKQLNEYEQKLNTYYELMVESDQQANEQISSPARTEGPSISR